ncbi:MAG: hypothetical protein QXW81_01120 [Archaeoglobaceae archaeon]
MKVIVDEAIKICEKQGHRIEKVIVVKRLGISRFACRCSEEHLCSL